MNEKYSSILNLPHHVSKIRPQMSMYQRAAQFTPFAALTGHNAAIDETARLTDTRVELSESECISLNSKITHLREHLSNHPSVSVTYFVPDNLKEGGRYTSLIGVIKRLDDYEQTLVFVDGTCVPIKEVIDIKGDLFDHLSLLS